MASQYYAVLTEAGAALEARALATGKGVILTHIAIGDANLSAVTPDPAVTRLVHEVHRRPIDSRSRDKTDPKITLLHATIPADVGGWWIYELGVIGHLEGESAEVLYAYANHGRYYKVLPQDGQTITHELTIPIIQSTDADLTIELPDAGYVTSGLRHQRRLSGAGSQGRKPPRHQPRHMDAFGGGRRQRHPDASRRHHLRGGREERPAFLSRPAAGSRPAVQ